MEKLPGYKRNRVMPRIAAALKKAWETAFSIVA
jgi:hypothetical protein